MTDLPSIRASEALFPEAVKSLLTANILGKRIEFYRQVGSTNDLAQEAARRGEREGLVVLAEEQITGRGRFGRRWAAPPGSCILCSVLLRPRFSAQQAFYVTIIASLAIYRAVQALLQGEEAVSPEVRSRPITCEEVAGRHRPALGIKWPNDVLLNGRKLSGVLSEGEFKGGEWLFSVVGFGINVNLAREQLGELQDTATSISAELGREIDRASLLARVLSELESLYLLLQGGQFGDVHASWVGALETLGKQVSVSEIGSMQDGVGPVVEGRALRVDADGALVVLTSGGIERRVLAGDVRPPGQGSTC